MKIPKRLLFLLEGVIVLFIGWAAVGVFMHSQSLDSVTVTLSEGGEEYHDKTLLGIGQADVLPDYWLRAKTTGGVVNLGSYANRLVGEGLSFTPQQTLPAREIVGFELLDKDTFGSDVLEAFPYESDRLVGVDYTLEIDKGLSLESGFAWFFMTPIGLAILAGLILGIAGILLFNSSLWWW